MDEEFQKAIIKQKYDFYVKNRKNYSKNVDEILEKIKNGYDPNEADIFEILNDDETRNMQYRSMFELKQRVKDGKISFDDFNHLMQIIGVNDEKMIYELQKQFSDRGILLDAKEYKGTIKK